MKDFLKDDDLIRLERLDYTDQVLDAISNWKRNPQLIDLEKFNKYKEIIMSKIKDKKIPYTTEIERITIDTNSQGKKEEEFILSLEFDDIYLNFIEDVFFTSECSSLQYNSNSPRNELSDINELCEIWGERPLGLKELFYNMKNEQTKQNGEINKENEFEKRFLYIERDLIRENKFSIAKSELGKIIHDAKIKNHSEVLDRARELLRFCNSKEREFSKKLEKERIIREELEKERLEKELLERERIKKEIVRKKHIENLKKRFPLIEKLIQEMKFSNAIGELNTIKNIAKKNNLSEIINWVDENLDLCNKLEVSELKKRYPTIEKLIQEMKFSDAIGELNTIKNNAKRNGLHEIINWAESNLKICNELLIKKTVIELGIKFARLQIAEISEVCGKDDIQLIVDIVKDMIAKKEIYAQYFSSTKSVAFDQQANIDEIDKLMSTYKDWEDEKVGKK